MPDKYHIPVKDCPPRFEPVGKYATIEFREECAGSCRECVKKNCVYGIFKNDLLHMQSMDEPEYLYACQSCFRCIQECTRGIFSRVVNPEYRTLGDSHYRADTIHRSWYQAHTGKIPVSGAGYRGPFVSEGFDSMWTDMSEIVRPTRDGIHGREYINTSFELSGRLPSLKFDKNGNLLSEALPILEIPMPVIMQFPDDLPVNESTRLAAAKAARELQTMLLVSPQEDTSSLSTFGDHLIPCVSGTDYRSHADFIRASRAVEIAYGPNLSDIIKDIKAIHPGIAILARIPLDRRSASRAVELSRLSVDTIHCCADSHGYEQEANPRFLKEAIRDVHLALVDAGRRQKINLVFSGGIAMAEHMAKAIICGADGVVADRILMVALECRLCHRCQKGMPCPVGLDGEFDADWGSQRIVNLMGAWHNQLIEVMGAMGIREARRLRGEVGRSMWFEDLEMEHFGPIFGARKATGLQ